MKMQIDIAAGKTVEFLAKHLIMGGVVASTIGHTLPVDT